ncbi:MAG: L-fucose/L-arabinose isomerase family protein [Spirochaetales bacterium]
MDIEVRMKMLDTKQEQNGSVLIGLMGIGLDTYWPQFSGLKERLEGYQRQIADRIRSTRSAEILDVGIVDNPVRARQVGSLFRQKQVDLIFLYITTYALSSTVLPVVQAAGAPLVVLNIQPVAAIDYESFNSLGDRGVMTGEWLAHCQACCVPEIASVFHRAGIPFSLVTGYLQDAQTWESIEEWVQAAHVLKGMRENRMRVMGHYYGGMLDVYTDMTAQLAAFGGHIELIEMDELAEIRKKVGGQEIEGKLEEFHTRFDVAPECEKSELERAARTSVALDTLVQRHRLGSLAYYYEGQPGNEHEDIITSVIVGNTLLTGSHVPVAGECEIKNVQAMKILDLIGAGGSFSEFYAMDFNDDVVLLGHDGPGHFAIAEGRVRLVPLPVYHGKPGKGLSIQMSVKHGPVTVLSVCERAGKVFLLVAEGESVPGPTLQIGNTNSRYRFPIPAREFIDRWSMEGPSHHCAVGIGHVGKIIEKFGFLSGLEVKRVC